MTTPYLQKPILTIRIFSVLVIILTLFSQSDGQTLCPGAMNCAEAQVFCSYSDIDDFSSESFVINGKEIPVSLNLEATK